MRPDSFHPAVSRWFRQQFQAATRVQERAWPAIRSGSHTLISAPTGSGKTLAAFLSVIDDLVRQSLAHQLCDETQVLYVSPLKALSNDVHKNLQVPLAGIRDELLESGQVKPVIDRRYPLAEVAEALRFQEEGHAREKIVITV